MDIAATNLSLEALGDLLVEFGKRIAALEKRVETIENWPEYVSRLANLEGKVSALETGRPPHMARVERRVGFKPAIPE
jgi:hypothetical protein